MRSANGYFLLSQYGRHKGLWIAVTFAALLLSACGGSESASSAGENSVGNAVGNAAVNAASSTILGSERRTAQVDCAVYLDRLARTDHLAADFAQLMDDSASTEQCIVQPRSKLLANQRLTKTAQPINGFINFESAHVHPIDLTPDGKLLLAVNTGQSVAG